MVVNSHNYSNTVCDNRLGTLQQYNLQFKSNSEISDWRLEKTSLPNEKHIIVTVIIYLISIYLLTILTKVGGARLKISILYLNLMEVWQCY